MKILLWTFSTLISWTGLGQKCLSCSPGVQVLIWLHSRKDWSMLYASQDGGDGELHTSYKTKGLIFQYIPLTLKRFKISLKMFSLSQFIFMHLADWCAFPNVSSRSPAFQKHLQNVSVSIDVSNWKHHYVGKATKMKKELLHISAKTNRLFSGFPFPPRPVKSWRSNMNLMCQWPQCTLPVLL